MGHRSRGATDHQLTCLLESDPLEQRNVAAQHPDRCDRLRQRLVAWTEANRRQYERVESETVSVIPRVVGEYARQPGDLPW